MSQTLLKLTPRPYIATSRSKMGGCQRLNLLLVQFREATPIKMKERMILKMPI
jgi:hypothetical protein